jgi:hypothetical protein
LGETEEALRSLAAAEVVVGADCPRMMKSNFGDDWADWLFAETLYREAVGLIR